MVPDDDITLGEVIRVVNAMEGRFNRQFDEVKAEVKAEVKEVNRRLDGLQFVNRDTYQAEMRALKEDIDDLKDSRKWQNRSLVVAFLFPVLVGVVVALAVSYAS